MTSPWGTWTLRAAILVAAAAVLLAGSPRDAEAATAGRGPAAAPGVEPLRTAAKRRPRAPSQAVVARRLAGKLSRARTLKQREAALLEVMRALRIGVYSSRGKALVRGAERGPRSFYMYRFQVRALAVGLERRQRFSLDAVAAGLAGAGVRLGSAPPTGRQLAAEVAAGTQRMRARPRDPYALGPLLVRELGLRARPRVDTATVLAPDAPTLDALQRALLVADVATAAHRRAAARRGGRARKLRAASIAKPPQPSQGQRDKGRLCAFLGADSTDTKGWKIGKWLFDKVIAETPVGTVAEKLATPATNLWHATFLGLFMDFQPTRGGQVTDTHYGPLGDHPGFMEPHYPGHELVFQVGAQLLADIPDDDVKCGKLAKLEFPNGGKKGPVEGVPVDWDPLISPGDYKQLLQHGTITREDRKTGKDGIAVLKVRPRDEAAPGVGPLVREIGVVQPGADLVGSFGNEIAELFELIAPRPATIGWSVEFHQQHVFDVSVTGAQTTTWEARKEGWDHQCDVSWDGRGKQTLHFATDRPVRAVFFRGEPYGAADPTAPLRIHSPAMMFLPHLALSLPTLVDRQGEMHLDGHPDCASGGDGEDPGPPPAPDCGVRDWVLPALIEYRETPPNGRHTLLGQGHDGAGDERLDDKYRNCPGPGDARLMAVSGAGPTPAEIEDPSLGRLVARGRDTDHELRSDRDHFRRDTTTEWTVTYERVR